HRLRVKRNSVCIKALPGIAVANYLLHGVGDIEDFGCFDLTQFIPRKRHRHRCAYTPAQTVRRNDTLSGANAVDIHEHPPLAGILLDVKRGRIAVAVDKWPGDAFRGLEYGMKIPARLNRATDMDALAAGSFYKRRISIPLNLFFEIK